MYMYKGGTNSQYQIGSFVKKSLEGFECLHLFLIIFYQCCSHLAKTGYCFITISSLVPVSVST